jgi:hypothetical protein
MSTTHKSLTRPDLRNFDENRSKFSTDELRKYAGHAVAFSPDGTRIVADGPDFLTAWNRLKASGIDPSQFVWEDVPPLDAEDSLL